MPTEHHHPLWDLPTRLFHWLLVIGFVGAWASYKWGSMEWHAYLGYGTLSLLLFRIGWGLWGRSETEKDKE